MKDFLRDKKMRIALAIIMVAAVAVICVLTMWAGGDASTTEDGLGADEAYGLYDNYELKEDVLADSGDIDTEQNHAGQDTSEEADMVEDGEVSDDVVFDSTSEDWSDEGYEEEWTGDTEVEYTFRYDSLLESHYEKHGIDMGFASEEEYLAAANAVINNPDALHKIEAEDGDDVYYVEATNEFVVVAPDGYIRTYFLPDDGIDYYNRQ